MKALYVAPSTRVIFASPILMTTDSVGHDDPSQSLGKETVVVEEETGIPTKFSNIWGDEEDED